MTPSFITPLTPRAVIAEDNRVNRVNAEESSSFLLQLFQSIGARWETKLQMSHNRSKVPENCCENIVFKRLYPLLLIPREQGWWEKRAFFFFFT